MRVIREKDICELAPHKLDNGGGGGGGGDLISSPSLTPMILEELSEQEEENKLKESKLKSFFKNITIEPVMFLNMFGIASMNIITQNLYIDRICRVKLGQSEELCRNLTKNIHSDQISDELRVSVDHLASEFTLYRGIIDHVFPILISLFLGSWSDKHGNKLPLLLPVFGHFLQTGLYLLFTYLRNLGPEYLLISAVPVSLTGGMAAVILSAFSFISRVTTNKSRSVRMAALESAWLLGLPLGILTAAKVYRDLSFAGVYIVAATVFTLALAYGIFFVQDDKLGSDEGMSCSKYCSDMANVSSVKETFVTVFRKRESSKRMWLFMLIVAICIRIVSHVGPHNCMFLYTRFMFGWNEQQYSLLTTLEGTLTVLGGLLMTVVCVQVFHLTEPLIGFLSGIGYLAANLVIAFAPRDPSASWMMYLATFFQVHGVAGAVMLRTMLSKLVPKEELGKVFTFVACAETTMPILANLIYSQIFIRTEQSFPGAFSLLTAALNLLLILNFLYFYIIVRMRSPGAIVDEKLEPPAKKINIDASVK